MPDLVQVITGAQSSEKDERKNAETELFRACNQDAGKTLASLVNIASQPDQLLPVRQFALLSLRKFITMYWSAGFESYVGPPGVNEEYKTMIRQTLLRLCLDDNQENKIIQGSSYCVVQIAAVEFPDEWPELLDSVYGAIMNSRSVSAVCVLIEIFDDVVSEEIFFQTDVGFRTIEIALTILKNPDTSVEAKCAAARLYRTCLSQLQSPMVNTQPHIKETVVRHVNEAFNILFGLLQELTPAIENAVPKILELQVHIYDILCFLKENLFKKVLSGEQARNALSLTLKALQLTSSLHYNGKFTAEEEQEINLSELGIKQVSLLSALQEIPLTQEEMELVIRCFVLGSFINDDVSDLYMRDVNAFVTKETGLAASFYVRDEIEDYLLNLVSSNYNLALRLSLQYFLQDDFKEGKLKEALLFIIESLAKNDEETEPFEESNIIPVLQSVQNLISDDQLHEILKLRSVLLMPQMLEKFMDSLPNVKEYIREVLTESLEVALNSPSNLIRASALLSFTYYSSFSELPTVMGQSKFFASQNVVATLIGLLEDESEEDTLGFLLETLHCALVWDETIERDYVFEDQALHLVLKLSARDPANIQVVLEAQDCLNKILSDVPSTFYVRCANTCIPLFVDTLKKSIENDCVYSPIVSLSLELLAVFMRKKPSEGYLPPQLTEFVFQPLANMLIGSSDDELLPVTTDALAFLINNSEKQVIAPYLPTALSILQKLLSVDTSDSASMNVGPLIISIFESYSDELINVFPQILDAATRKLIEVQNIATAENLIYVFCYLASINVKQMIDFLCTLQIDNSQNALEPVLSKWFESFEVTRGARRIKENILALSKIFFLNDSRVANTLVRGELIPYSGDTILTRSMAKKMPLQYTKVSAYERIVKLFVTELGFQNAQPTVDKFIPAGMKAEPKSDEGDEWEDVDDVLEYNKLQEFIDDDGPDDDFEEDEELFFTKELQQSVPELLVQFFREVAAKNVSHFSEIYQRLSDNDKKTLSESLV
ncbi:LAMI_0D01838g1_1 [Lachancea mirantina]|uniref:LAMI_0D01838g1_1 n=1 Tax=Lachancea mirantina TaxID=1230905 RepID=A0A1G4J914_9SACH|nr:LAMI_0D01838g1_1 [Lachancea mirantina]